MTQSEETWQHAYKVFFDNILRVHRLIGACTSHSEIDDEGHPDLDQAGCDIALSAVVFLYATFETFVREISRKKGGTYSTVKEVENVLKRLEIDYSEQSEYLPSIGKMMKRRHRIVHRADIALGASEPEGITYEDSVSITRWFLDVDFFVSELVQLHLTPQSAAFVERKLQERKATRARVEKQQQEQSD